MQNIKSIISVSGLALFMTVSVALAASSNAPINPADYQQAIKLACVGDSITAGVGAQPMEFNSYPALLKRMLGDKWEIKNYGASGATLMNSGNDPYQKKNQVADVVKWGADVIVISLGTNDTKPQNWEHKSGFVDDYKALIATYKTGNPNARIFVCRPVWVAGQGNFGINEPALLEALPMIDQVAADTGSGLIDLHAALLDKPEFIPDRVHPNNGGYELMARTIYQTLTGKPFNGEIPQEAKSEWGGFEKKDFVWNGRMAQLVSPSAPEFGKPWIWRTEFFGHEPQGDIALLRKGWHVAYVNISGMYGSPEALDVMDGFYKEMTQKYGLSDKVVLEGFSRGGLYAFNWAARRPANVRSIYVDAPVLDFKSWPGGKGAGKGSEGDWKNVLQRYKLTEEEALAYKLNPVDNLKPLADAHIPVLSVIGDADVDVPPAENTLLMETRYKELGGEVKVISKPGVGHHPHSLKDPKPIVDFILAH